MARREKKPVHKVVMTEGKRNIIQQLLQEYDIETAEDIQDALKDLLGGTIKEMMEAEMDDHLGYQKSERSDSDDYRNGYKSKRVNSSYGSMDIDVPQDRKSTFEPQIVKKRQKDISDIDQKIIITLDEVEGVFEKETEVIYGGDTFIGSVIQGSKIMLYTRNVPLGLKYNMTMRDKDEFYKYVELKDVDCIVQKWTPYKENI